MRRLMAAETARRSTRVARRASVGQTLIIFALTFTVLIGFMGLAIDSIRVYDLYARMQRAAEAGALAGVIYMPNNYSVDLPSSPTDNAVCRAQKLVFKNSFGATPCTDASDMPAIPCPTPPSSVEVAVCPVKNEPFQLQVYVTEPIDVLFLGALNVGPVTITASAIAAYLPPVNIASDPTGTGSNGSWGTFGECNGASSACTGTGSVRNWAGNINGPGELKEQGDPLVTCAEGPGTPSNIDQDASILPLQNMTYVGMPTNHPQYGITAATVGGCGNTDTQGAFTGPIYYDPGSNSYGQTHVGYAYFVDIPKGANPQDLWVWNAPFSPSQPKSCNGRSGGQSATSYDIFFQYNCSGSSGTSYTNYTGAPTCTLNPYSCQDPNLYFSVTYSIYLLTGPTDITGTLQAAFTAWPYAGQGSCGKGQYEALPATAGPYSETTLTGLSTSIPTCITSPCVANWCPVANQLGDNVGTLWSGFKLTSTGSADQFYRVSVVASDYGTPTNFHYGYGAHAYSMKLCPDGTTQAGVQTCTPGGSIGGWNLSDAVFLFPGNGGGGKPQTTEYPLGVIDKSFAGRTLDVQLYDPGDLSGNNGAPKGATYYAVAPPTGAADPCTATTTQLTAAGYSNANFVFPSGERTATLNNLPALEPALNGDLLYNGLWVDEQISVPSTYQFSNATWTLCAQAPQTTDADVLGIGVFALGQSPVHLIQ
jgi:Putative Flp pilus-assembly TadE/G-like